MAPCFSRLGASLASVLPIVLLVSCSDQTAVVTGPRSLGASRTLGDGYPSAETAHAYICKNGVPGASYDFTYVAATMPPTSGATTVVVPHCNLIRDVATQGSADLTIMEVPQAGSSLFEVDVANGLTGVALQNYFAAPGGSLDGTPFTVSVSPGLQLLAVFNNATTCPATVISSNFNGTPIAGGHSIWFNSVVKPSGVTPAGGTLLIRNSTVTFTASGANYTVAMPSSVITFSPTATTATTVFDGVRWLTAVPWNYTGNVFAGGVAFPVPTGGFAGGINPAFWSAAMTTDVSGLRVNWQWGAAVYAAGPSNPNDLGVKPVDGNMLSQYLNSDHPGTPEFLKAYVLGGARGGGGSNFTGSYSGTASTSPCVGR